MGQQITPPGSGQPAGTPPQGQPTQPAAPAPQVGDGGNGVPLGTQVPDPFAGIQTDGRTPAEIEAEYRARLGGHQRGWNAAERALREENETLRRQLAGGASQGSTGQQGAPDANNAQVEELRRRVEEAERGRVAAERKAKYPTLAGMFTDDVFGALDDANLAKLSATLEDNLGGGTFIAPTAPRRSATPPAEPKPIAERSKQELLADLARLAPEVVAAERARMGQSG